MFTKKNVTAKLVHKWVFFDQQKTPKSHKCRVIIVILSKLFEFSKKMTMVLAKLSFVYLFA